MDIRFYGEDGKQIFPKDPAVIQEAVLHYLGGLALEPEVAQPLEPAVDEEVVVVPDPAVPATSPKAFGLF